MHRIKILSTWTAVVASVLVAGCKEKNTFAPPPPPEVTVASPEVKDVTVYHQFPGRLQAQDEIEIRARVSGYLRSVDFVDGQRVKKGDQLCIIEPEPYEAALRAANANLGQAEANQTIAKTNYERRKQAYDKSRAISEIDVLKAKADLDQANAVVLGAKAAIQQSEIELSYTTNIALANGRLSESFVSVGNVVGGGDATLLARLIVEDPIQLYLNVAERDFIPFLNEGVTSRTNRTDGPEITLELADGTRYEKTGKVDFIDNRVDPETGTITVRAVFPNPDGMLVPGLYGKALIPKLQENAVVVPDLSVQRDIGGTYVLTVDAEDTVQSSYVKLGAKVDASRIIEEGLDGSERIVVNGIQRARPGIKVTPRTQAAAKTAAAQPQENQ